MSIATAESFPKPELLTRNGPCLIVPLVKIVEKLSKFAVLFATEEFILAIRKVLLERGCISIEMESEVWAMTAALISPVKKMPTIREIKIMNAIDAILNFMKSP
jgi:hypothetical protein